MKCCLNTFLGHIYIYIYWWPSNLSNLGFGGSGWLATALLSVLNLCLSILKCLLQFAKSGYNHINSEQFQGVLSFFFLFVLGKYTMVFVL